MRRFWAGLAIAISLAAITAGGVVIVQDDAPAAGEANEWVVASGAGSCTRSATPIDYATAVSNGWTCGSFDGAWDASTAGDTIRVKAGTYGTQVVTGDKGSTTKFIAEDGVELTDTLEAWGNNGWFENITVDTGCPGSGVGEHSGGYVQGLNVTWVDVDMWGCRVSVQAGHCCEGNGGDGFYWNGGTLGEPGTTGSDRELGGDGQPLTLYGPDDVTIEGVQFNPQTAGSGFHLETIRVQADSPDLIQDLTVRDNNFVSGSEIGSGYLFITSVASSSTAANGLRLINNYFGVGTSGSYTIQTHTNVTTATGWLFAYNTWNVPSNIGSEDLGTWPSDESGMTWVGNLGAKPFAACDGTYIKNVWQNNTNVACGTDTWVNGPARSLSALGVGGDGFTLQAGSAAIDAAETPGASDHCTDPASVNSLDYSGGVRPVGSVCDAGVDERD